MNEQEKAHYEEWKQKCAITRARKKQERVQERAKLLKDKPGYRIPTRGPKKGQLVWMGYRQQQLDMNMALNAEKIREAAAKRAIEATNRSQNLAAEQAISTTAKQNESRPHEVLVVIFAYLFVCGVTLTYIFIAKAIAHFGFLGLAIFLDFLLYSALAKKSYRSRYAPFVWWFLMQRK